MRAVTNALTLELLSLPLLERDAFVNRRFGFVTPEDDGPALPRDGVPYLPAPVQSLIDFVALSGLSSQHAVLDVGSGAGRAAVLLHLLSGARVHGVEVQPHLVAAHRATAARLGVPVTVEEGDALASPFLAQADAFFLYCPFNGPRVAQFLSRLEREAQQRPLIVGCVDLPLPHCAWLERVGERDGLTVFRSSPRPR